MSRLNDSRLIPCLIMALCATTAVFGDPESVDFDAYMTQLAAFNFGGSRPLSMLAPEWADLNENGILDATEFAVLSAIFANPSTPNHDVLHEAWKANYAQLAIDLGALAEWQVPNLKRVGAAYMLLGDGTYRSFSFNGTRYGYDFTGSLGAVAEVVYTLTAYGSVWADGAPALLNYKWRPALVSVCGDADNDGVRNIEEFFGQGGNRTDYVAAAIDPAISINGGDPSNICLHGGPFNINWGQNYFYNPANKYLYLIGFQAPWIVQQAYAENFNVAGFPIPGNLATVDSSELSDWIQMNPVRALNRGVWIGGTDQAVEGVWKWIATNTQFWQGAADGNAIGGAYTHWAYGEPNDSLDEDFLAMDYYGNWNDARSTVSETGLIELANGGYGWEDSDSNGRPDVWETVDEKSDCVQSPYSYDDPCYSFVVSNDDYCCAEEWDDQCDMEYALCSGWEVEGEGEGEGEGHNGCDFEGVFDNEGTYLADNMPVLASQLAARLVSFDMFSWELWDIENILNVAIPRPGDGLRDSFQTAMLECVLCGCNNWVKGMQPDIQTQMTHNKALFEEDILTLSAYDSKFMTLMLVNNLFPALIGSSQDMANTINAIIRALANDYSGLPNFASYEIFGVAKDGSEPFSSMGDLDGDGLSNLQELAMVLDAGGDRSLFIQAVTDPTNTWHGNPKMPVGNLIGMALIAMLITSSGIVVIRSRK